MGIQNNQKICDCSYVSRPRSSVNKFIVMALKFGMGFFGG